MADEVTVEVVQAQLAAANARIKELNDEAKGHRLNANEARRMADEARTEMERLSKETGEKVTAAEKAAKDAGERAAATMRDAALRIAAKEAGILDLDGLKLLDTSAVKIKDDGSVAIPEKFFEEAKAAKPYLFKQTGADTGTTGSTAKTPDPRQPAPKHAKDMSDAEFDAALRQLSA